MNFFRAFGAKRVLSERGAVAVIVGILIVVLFGFIALAVDIGHIYAVKNELQNAADSGALAGAAELYNFDPVAKTLSINPGANDEAYTAAIAHLSDKENVETLYAGLGSGDNANDIQRGHWSFAPSPNCTPEEEDKDKGCFDPNDSILTYTGNFLVGRTNQELNDDLNFINAVKVRTRREQNPAISFFAGIFGYQGFKMNTDAVAWLGYAGDIVERGVDLPIALCMDKVVEDPNGSLSLDPPILDGDEFFECTTGRLINSGPNPSTNETGGWTSFYQEANSPTENECVKQEGDPCGGGTNANELKCLVDPPGPDTCVGSNPNPINIDENMATLGGEAQSAFNKLRGCWIEATDTLPVGTPDGIPDIAWPVRLPVIICPGNNVGTCEEVWGFVDILLVWITQAGEGPSCQFAQVKVIGQDPVTGEDILETSYNYPPLAMTAGISETESISYTCTHTQAAFDAAAAAHDHQLGQQMFDECWDEFTTAFNLLNPDENGVDVPAPCQKKGLYWRASCDVTRPTGGTGGRNFGILAEVPVLVE